MIPLPQLTTHHLRVEVRVQTPLVLGKQPGQQIRGALFNTLRRHYCPAANANLPGHTDLCPVCWLLSREENGGWRGRDPVRPYAIAPPLPSQAERAPVTCYAPGDTFSFGIMLVGAAIHLFPHLALAMPEMGRTGIGTLLAENGGQRGRFHLVSLHGLHPLTGDRQTLLAEGAQTVQMPTLPITTAHIIEAAEQCAQRVGPTLRVRFLTPTRITTQGRLLHRPHFRPLFGRLIDRVEGLAREYGDVNGMEVKAALAAAEQVELVDDATRWCDLSSHSSRTGRELPAGGFVGAAAYRAPDWRPLLPWLLWGTLVHVGKNAVKGEGIMALDGFPLRS